MGGPKPELMLHERRLIDHVIDGIPAESKVIVVGPEILTERDVHFCVEDPRFGGPVAGLAAGLVHVRSTWFALVAVDMPGASEVIHQLTVVHSRGESTRQVDALIPIDREGVRQSLCALMRTEAVRRAVAGLPTIEGASMRALLDALDIVDVPVQAEHLLKDYDLPGDFTRN